MRNVDAGCDAEVICSSHNLTHMPAQANCRSQLISPFGIGAMVDFPRTNH
jgi:hypothetical protein